MLKIYNTKSRQKEKFQPIDNHTVKVYVCGMTVYDFCHVGHARVMVFFDTMVKHLKNIGYSVEYVRNITDIDDKIITRANNNNEDFLELVSRFIKAMHKDSIALNIDPPTAEPRATDFIKDIIAMIETLIAKKAAYLVDGDVYFAVNQFDNYGQLSGKNTDDLLSGVRIKVDTRKRSPLDFALWKSAKPNEPYWKSPWGDGRPGWHIECSAMSDKLLGTHFDIHGGGMDLIFPHHENEIAQSQMCTGHKHVNTWMHVGFVRINDEKMSKSLDNFFTIHEVLEQYPAEVIRLFLLSSHYRSPLNYNTANLQQAQSSLNRLYKTLVDVDLTNSRLQSEWQDKFNSKMNDDFNTPEALAVLFDLAKTANHAKNNGDANFADLAFTLKELSHTLGVLTQNPDDFLKQQATNKDEDNQEIDALVALRDLARHDKDWAKADTIRDQLAQMKVHIEDGADGTKWYRY